MKNKTPPPAAAPPLSGWHLCETTGRYDERIVGLGKEPYFEPGQPGYIRTNVHSKSIALYQLMTVNAAEGKMWCWHLRATDFPRVIRVVRAAYDSERAAIEKEWTQWWFQYYRR